MPRLRPPFQYATEPDEDDLQREGNEHSLVIMVGLGPHRYASETKQRHDDGVPDIEGKELDQRIRCAELELGTLLALRDGNRKVALECNRELQAEDEKLAAILRKKSGGHEDNGDE